MIIWYTVPEIWQVTHVNCYFSFWAIFCPFTSLTVRKIKIKEKIKKELGDIIILHKCTINHDHMLYCSWDIVCDGCSYFFFVLGYFLPFTPLLLPNSPKNQNFKKWEKHLEISSFYTRFILRYGARRTDARTDWKSDI